MNKDFYVLKEASKVKSKNIKGLFNFVQFIFHASFTTLKTFNLHNFISI